MKKQTPQPMARPESHWRINLDRAAGEICIAKYDVGTGFATFTEPELRIPVAEAPSIARAILDAYPVQIPSHGKPVEFREARALRAFINHEDGCVVIDQSDELSSGAVVEIAADQISLLVSWLREFEAELLSPRTPAQKQTETSGNIDLEAVRRE